MTGGMLITRAGSGRKGEISVRIARQCHLMQLKKWTFGVLPDGKEQVMKNELLSLISS